MIKRGNCIIFGLPAQLGTVRVGRTRRVALVSKSGRRGETFIGQGWGRGAPRTPAEVLTDPRSSRGSAVAIAPPRVVLFDLR